MASDSATFTLKLIDRISGPARGAAKALSAVEKQLKGTPRTAGRSTRALTTHRRSVREAGHAAKEARSNFADFLKAGLATSAISFATGAIKDLTLAVLGAGAHLVTFGQNSRFAFDQLAKHGATGVQLFAHARALAVRFGLDVEDTAHSYANFLKLQFDPKQAETMVKMGADLRSLGASADEVKGIFLALGQIKGKGRLQAQEMLQLAERGVSTELVQEEIGKALGGKSRVEVQKLQEAGKISAEVGLAAIESAINRKLQQSEVGTAGSRFAEKTFEGISGRAKALATDTGLDLVSRIEATLTKLASGGLTRVSKFLDSDRGSKTLDMLAGGLAKAVTFAERLVTTFGGGFLDTIRPIYGAFKPLLDRIAGGEGSTLTNTLMSAARYAGQLAAVGLTLTGVVAGLVTGFVVLANGVRVVLFGAFSGLATAWIESAGKLIFSVVDTWENVKAIISAQGLSFYEKALAIGKSVVTGFVEGIKAFALQPIKAVTGMVGGAIDAAKGLLKSNSPSKVTMGLGGDYGEGYAIGIEDKRKRVAGAAQDLAEASLVKPTWTSWDTAAGGRFSEYGTETSTSRGAAHAIGAAAAGSATGGGSRMPPINVNVYVESRVDPQRGRELGHAAGRAARVEIESMFRSLALEG